MLRRMTDYSIIKEFLDPPVSKVTVLSRNGFRELFRFCQIKSVENVIFDNVSQFSSVSPFAALMAAAMLQVAVALVGLFEVASLEGWETLITGTPGAGGKWICTNAYHAGPCRPVPVLTPVAPSPPELPRWSSPDPRFGT